MKPVTDVSEHPLPICPGHTLDRVTQYTPNSWSLLDHPLSRVMTS